MKWFVVFAAVALCLGHADDISEKRGVLTRRTKRALGNMGAAFLKRTEKSIIRNCKVNGLSDEGAQKLQGTYDAMRRCLDNSTIFLTSKVEYVQQMVDCSKDAVSETKDCLKPNQKYFPDFILDLLKSFVNFVYDDKPILDSPDIPRCMKNFNRSEVQLSYFVCITTAADKSNDDAYIPNSKKEFCNRFFPAGECFPKTLNEYCDHTDIVNKFTRDYITALEEPCEVKQP